MTDLDTLGRRDRFRPAPTGKRVTLKARDREWLAFLARHGPLPSPYLHLWTIDTHPNPKATRMRLTDLASETNTPHGGAYLVRPAAQRQIENARNRPLIYDLSECGWAALGRSRSDLVRASGPFWHQVMVACITAAIEIACADRPDISYIPAGEILMDPRKIAADVSITHPKTGKPAYHRLVPDQLFALAYHTANGTSFRAYLVECDRATEPITSPNMTRKSYLRSYLQYREFVGRGLYKQQYGLKCPLMVLNVMTSAARQRQFLSLIDQHAPAGNGYMLFQHMALEALTRLPCEDLSELLQAPWARAGDAPMTVLSSG